jgi:hypothetical protein
MISGWSGVKYLPLFLGICATIYLLGCGKKETSQTSTSQSGQPQPTSAAPISPNTPSAPPATAAAAPRDSYEAQVTARSIDYFKGQVARKNWPQARQALAAVEARSLTPGQRQYVDSLKTQIPAN